MLSNMGLAQQCVVLLVLLLSVLDGAHGQKLKVDLTSPSQFSFIALPRITRLSPFIRTTSRASRRKSSRFRQGVEVYQDPGNKR